MKRIFGEEITTLQELEEVAGNPSQLAAHKVISFLDEHCREFIRFTPFITIATHSSTGSDVSPRGDKPGFIQVLDDYHLLIPERPGNKRMDSMRNIVENPMVGLLFMIPGRDETLRINGIATIVKDKSLLARFEHKGKTPLFGIGVEVKECFIHCGKALKRSHLWEPERWPNIEGLAPATRMLSDHAKIGEDHVAESLKDSYTNRLY
ncbi:pyridoxamine 5'-phosphate oxidase family protein [Pseudalkalibacillus hwajinpoensis]|uniref:pyridoxamine 5'-phosphate oxidase family protein n=1 Tax=Guptibacillus hwajinpoensis TaxID=208199 RepID=UPI001CD40384|nr:pyridoxamine 5'-phosphate oxidase family protein [Pseudalkalibacillus hwajinpoensis]MCA0992054.1 pyridoxamine 5'-phosphate oxidase family protein [Pseudalkalibacillus hwajinpoensis]